MKGGERRTTMAMLRNSFERRTVVLSALQGGVGLLLAGRLGYLSVAQNTKYELEAESNRVNLTLIAPRRGWILDRNGTPLASNRADFRIDIIPDRLVDAEATVSELGKLLQLSPLQVVDLRDKLEKARGFQPVEVASGLDWERFAGVSVRVPDLPGVMPQRGFTRTYPTGPSVGHLLGYVGVASAEDYQKERNPLLITPGFKIGKDGLEKRFETQLRGLPGARRSEVTASGRVVRDLETREDMPGKSVRLAIDGPLQDYAARRIGLESGSVVVMDCRSGDVLCAASMPSFDPNSFSDGISRIEWKMLSDDDHVPLRNKVLRGLYPPGSTIKPMVALAFLEGGLDPEETVFCGGGLRVGDRVFHCWNRRGHGTVNMAKGIYQSCDVYFYHFAQRIGMDRIAVMARRLGLGQQFDLPVLGQSYGTVPDPAWKQRKYGKPWATFDTVNATIGQGYMLTNPLQLAVMSARIASGLELTPRLLHSPAGPKVRSLGISKEHLDFIHSAMKDVVHGAGTAGRARMPVPGVLLAGKTGTAQVVGLNISKGTTGPWKYRDHGLFVCFAPFDNPVYAAAVVIEHGGGSKAAYPIARDVMTFLFDQTKAMQVLSGMESSWGGTPQERMASKYRAYAAQYGVNAPAVAADAAEKAAASESAAAVATEQPVQSAAQSPGSEPEPDTAPAQPVPEPSPTVSPVSPAPSSSPVAAPSPAPSPAPAPSGPVP